MEAFARDFTMQDTYAQRVDSTFRYRDNQNNRRVLAAIEDLQKKGRGRREK